jgi:CheY-like chemotaxis protein
MLLEGKRILIVEDNTLNRVVYRMALGTQGASLEFDNWGREAVAKLKKSSKWDLVILDLMLSAGSSGFSVFKEIREMHEYDNVPIIAVSASEPSVAIPSTREMGFSGFISKPIDESLIAEQLARVIAGEKIWFDGTLFHT